MEKQNSTGISRIYLLNNYQSKQKSMQQIASQLGCSLNKVDYWMRSHQINRRTRSEAVYIRNNPDGDPFVVKDPLTPEETLLWGLGIGLYWGEGTKASKNSVRIGNSDPGVLLSFMKFLEVIYSVSKEKLKFGMQLFSDCDENEAMSYWCDHLGVDEAQFYKIHVTISGKIGSYRKKNKYGVVTLYFHNTKLQQILVDHINNMPR